MYQALRAYNVKTLEVEIQFLNLYFIMVLVLSCLGEVKYFALV